MGVFSLTNSSQRIDQAVNAVHSGLFPSNSGFLYLTGDQTVSGTKTFGGKLISRGGFDASGNVSGKFSPYNDGLVDLGAATNRFGTLYATEITGTNAVFGGNVTINGSLNANLNIGATGLNVITVTGTGFFQNVRVTGTTVLGGATTISGNIASSGNNVFAGTNTFQSTTSFQDPVFFEDSLTASGTSSIKGAATFHSSVSITGGTLTHNGTASLTGTLTHTGNFYQGGPSSLTGDLSVNGNSSFTGNVTVANGTTTIRSATTFTTGSSASDRLTINQNVDQTGDYNLTGNLRVSANLFVTGNETLKGSLTVDNTGYFSGLSNRGNLTGSGTNVLTGNNSLLGTNYVSGTTRVSGDLTIVAATGNFTKFDGYFRPYIIAQGIGINNITTGAMLTFWTSAGNAASTGVWQTDYSGRVGEVGLLMTGSSTSIAFNNNLPVGTYGKSYLMVNAGTKNGSGVWTPIGV